MREMRYGLANIGRTSDLNAVVQLAFAVKPLPNAVMRYDGDDLFLGSLSALFYRLPFSTEWPVVPRAFAVACVWPKLYEKRYGKDGGKYCALNTSTLDSQRAMIFGADSINGTAVPVNRSKSFEYAIDPFTPKNDRSGKLLADVIGSMLTFHVAHVRTCF
jgi:hypothetical protein